MNPEGQTKQRQFSRTAVLGIVLLTVAVTVLVTSLVIRAYVFPGEFEPVSLSENEQAELDAKLSRLELSIGDARGSEAPDTLEPGPYAESGASREISLTEKELNALIAHNTDLATRVAIDLSDSLASARILIPVDPEFPILGGRTLRVDAGMELAYADSRPVVTLKGVSVMGIPIPNAWLGNMKNVDLVGEFGPDAGFWKAFSDGVEQIQVTEGRVRIRLRE